MTINKPAAGDKATAALIGQIIDAITTTALSWTNITGLAGGAHAGTPTPQYVLTPDQQVFLRGQITATTTFAPGGVLLFTLPSAVWPTAGNIIVPVAWGGTATQTPTVKVDTAGGVTVFCTTGVANIQLDAVRYSLV